MRPLAALATLAALAVLALAVPAVAADPAPAAPEPPTYSLAPAPYAAPMPYGAWMGPPALALGRTNNAMRNAGIVFFALGAATTTAGIVVLNGAVLGQCEFDEPENGRASPVRRGQRGGLGVAQEALNLCDVGLAPGAVTIAVGAILGIIGVPLFVVGNRAALVPAPAVQVGAGTASLRWSF
jgi:hypothetical protein